MPPHPSAASCFSSATLIVTLAPLRALAAATTASAKSAGVRSPAGVFTQSRVRATAAATTWAVSKAARAGLARAASLSTTTSPGESSDDDVLYCVNE